MPLRPGQVERREFEYIRHGTLAFILNFDIAQGQVVIPSVGPTRTAADFQAHIEQTVNSDPTATRWHFVADNLNTPRLGGAGALCGPRVRDRGRPGRSRATRILQSMETRAAFLGDPSHQIVFHYTPKHASWLNQIEIWLSILVRKLLNGAPSPRLRTSRRKYSSSLPTTTKPWGKPFRWIYSGKPLTI